MCFGEPVPYDVEKDTVEEVVARSKTALESLIEKHQPNAKTGAQLQPRPARALEPGMVSESPRRYFFLRPDHAARRCAADQQMGRRWGQQEGPVNTPVLMASRSMEALAGLRHKVTLSLHCVSKLQ